MSDIYNFGMFVDCGAPSLYNKLSRQRQLNGVMGASFKDRKNDDFRYTETQEYEQYRQSYIDFLLKRKDEIEVYSNLDVINNPELTWRNQKELERAGLSPIPVFHLGSDLKWLHRYLRKYDYIAIGGMIPNTTKALIRILDPIFKSYLLDSKGFPLVKLHGFACTSPKLMIRYPWYSVDSTTCRKLAMYGDIFIPGYSVPEKPNTFFISERDRSLDTRYSPGILRAVSQYLERYNFSKEEIGASIIKRTALNYFYFSELVDRFLPEYPWSMFQKRNNKGELKKKLNFYMAGSLSRKEEGLFWGIVEKRKISQIKKRRLHSFFYKTQVEYLLSLKETE